MERSLKRVKYTLVILLFTAQLVGCSEGETLLESSAISGLITFNGKDKVTEKVTFAEVAADGTRVVNGECDTRIDFLEISVNNQDFSTPLSFGIGPGDLDCSDGKFSINVDQVATDLGLTASPTSKASIKVRGRTSQIITSDSIIHFKVISGGAAAATSIAVVVGSSLGTGGNIKLKTRIGMVYDGVTQINGNIKVSPQ